MPVLLVVNGGSLPRRARALNETHGAWTVTCAIGMQGEAGPVKRCALSQTQLHNQTRQRELAIELHPEGDGVEGTLVLPFGLALASGSPINSTRARPVRRSIFAPVFPPVAWSTSLSTPAPWQVSKSTTF